MSLNWFYVRKKIQSKCPNKNSFKEYNLTFIARNLVQWIQNLVLSAHNQLRWLRLQDAFQNAWINFPARKKANVRKIAIRKQQNGMEFLVSWTVQPRVTVFSSKARTLKAVLVNQDKQQQHAFIQTFKLWEKTEKIFLHIARILENVFQIFKLYGEGENSFIYLNFAR